MSDSPTPTPQYKPADASGPAQNVPLPVKPPLADEFSKAGIEAFAKYWYETLSYAYESGDTAPMDAITDPGCTTCAAAKSVIGKWHSAGRWIVGGRIHFSAAQSEFVATDTGAYQAVTQLQQDGGAFYNADRTLENTMSEAPILADIFVAAHREQGWIAQTVEHLGGKSS